MGMMTADGKASEERTLAGAWGAFVLCLDHFGRPVYCMLHAPYRSIGVCAMCVCATVGSSPMFYSSRSKLICCIDIDSQSLNCSHASRINWRFQGVEARHYDACVLAQYSLFDRYEFINARRAWREWTRRDSTKLAYMNTTWIFNTHEFPHSVA